MTKEELTKTRVQLYKATPLKLGLVDELIDTIKHCFGNNIETNGIRFDSNFLKLGGLYVKHLTLDELSGVLVHWQPNYNVSTKSDPYCSAYILTPKEIRKIIKTLQNVKEYYQKHSKV